MDLHAAMAFLHLVFAAIWTGSVVFVTWGVLPGIRTGSVGTRALETIVNRLRMVSRISAVVLLLTGGLMAGRYGGELVQTTEGHLILGMIVLWVLLIGFVEMAAKTVLTGLSDGAVTQAVSGATGHFRAAGVVAMILLVDAGLLTGL